MLFLPQWTCKMTTELSVVILSYNQFALTTGPCLQSLAGVKKPLLEIIVVDNGSDEETVNQLKLAAHKDPRIRLLLHESNRGYAAGNNDGVELASSGYILLLNSDTLVPENVPALLLRHLQAADTPCIVGPVTNAAGNEQQIYIREGSEEDSVLAQGEKWCKHACGSVFETDQLSFFCVAMAKEIYQALDGLDPSFGLGFYEDADFCCRAAQQGFSLQVLEHCFVYHHGSASFSNADVSVKKLLTANRKLFRARHGRSDGLHVRWKNLKILQRYLMQMHESGAFHSYLFENRLERARQLAPNNPLKKIAYIYHLHKVEKAWQNVCR